jgi:hypothetical protein
MRNDEVEIAMVNGQKVVWTIGDGQFDSRNLPRIPSTAIVAVDFGGVLGIAAIPGYDFVLVDRKADRPPFSVSERIIAIAGDRDVLVIAMHDSIVQIYNQDVGCLIMCTYVCAICCIEVSSVFDMIAVGSKEGAVVLCSLSRRSVDVAFEMRDKRPLNVKITGSWGIVVVVAADRYSPKHWICTFTLNGETIKEARAPSRPVALATFVSGSGFDYLAFADANGSVFVVDVVKLSMEKPIHVAQNRVIGLCYDTKKRQLVIVNSLGTITFIQKEWK